MLSWKNTKLHKRHIFSFLFEKIKKKIFLSHASRAFYRFLHIYTDPEFHLGKSEILNFQMILIFCQLTSQ